MNILLAGAMVLFLRYAAAPGLTGKNKTAAPKRVVAQAGVKGEKAETTEKTPSPSDYMIIAEQNLFHPQRVIPAPKVEAPPLPQPEFVLYGTLVTDSIQIAYMDDKKSEDKKGKGAQGKKQTALRLGDTMSGFVLKEVTRDQAIMQRGEEKISVSLSQAKVRETPMAAAAPTQAPALLQKPGGAPAAQQALQQPPPRPPRARSARRLRNTSGADE